MKSSKKLHKSFSQKSNDLSMTSKQINNELEEIIQKKKLEQLIKLRGSGVLKLSQEELKRMRRPNTT